MTFNLSIRQFSLRAALISSYLVILGIGGLATSIVGSWIVSSTIMNQARRKVDHDLETARMVYQQQLQTLKGTVELTVSGTTIQNYMFSNDSSSLLAYLDGIRRDNNIDFLTLTDRNGHVILRVTQPDRTRDDVSSISVVAAALSGEVATATEILSPEQLGNEDPGLPSRAYFDLVETQRAKPLGITQETHGMVLTTAAPVTGLNNEILGALYAGILLNRNPEIVDGVWEIIYKGERFRNKDVGTVTIFQNDLRISTNVKTTTGGRALGTRVSEEVYDAVLERGETWRDRAFVVNDWYISSYEPIRNYAGEIIGILYVGVLEKAYTTIRNRVILAFFGLATIGFILIATITYHMIRNITRPVSEMVAATQSISAGRFDQEVHSSFPGEIGQLADSFNVMLKSLRRMKDDLEEWGRTLEEKVQKRTEELVALQEVVARSERMASLGKLAAGVAHEINNPLGGILSLSALTLEEMDKSDPNRENLEEVVKQCERSRDIVKGLLEFSRQSEAQPKPVDVNIILGNTLALIEKQALFMNISVFKNWDPELPPIMADESQLQQVFMNIILNAVQAMEEEGTLTTISQLSSSDGIVEVLISDTGCGIPSDRIDRIFDPFFTTKDSGQGTGLGLSVAYGIVTRHGGTISVESEEGKGSTITIRLPVISGSDQEDQV